MPLEDHEFRDLVVSKLATLEKTTENTLVQATKTNGRVNKLEEKTEDHDILFAIAREKDNTISWWKDALGKPVIVLIIGAMGFGLSLVLQKTDIISVSTVPMEVYDSLPE